MIISMHAPKSGGTSFKTILNQHFGKSLLEDYSDKPINQSTEKRNQDAEKHNSSLNFLKKATYKLKGIQCIHGHFLPYKYHKFKTDKNVYFVTWLRDPVERLISHYYHWHRVNPANPAPLLQKNYTR